MLLNAIVPSPVREAIRARRGNRNVWLVGGAIRDHILGRPLLDLDFAVSTSARDLARKVADDLRAAYFDLDIQRDTGRVVFGRHLDFASIREETIEADLKARDFTINAMAIDWDNPDRILDPTRGIQDLKDRTLRSISNKAIQSDPVRAIRGVRLAVDFGFSIAQPTIAEIKEAHHLISNTSMERLRDEFMRVLEHSDPSIALRMMDRLQQLDALHIDTEPLKQITREVSTGWETTLRVVHDLSRILLVMGIPFREEHAADLTLGKLSGTLGRYRESMHAHLERPLAGDRNARQSLFLAALLMNVAAHPCNGYEETLSSSKLADQKAMNLKLSRREASAIKGAISLQGSIGGLDEHQRAAYRLSRRGGDCTVEAVLLNLARYLACHAPTPPQAAWDAELNRSKSILEFAFAADPSPIIRGDDLAQAMGIEPGEMVGELLETIREGQMLGEIADRESALAFAARRMQTLRERSQ